VGPACCDNRFVRMGLARGLVVVAVIFTVLSLLAGYVRFQGLDTETASNTAELLIADDEIRNELAAVLVEQLYANVDVAQSLEQRLPEDQKGLAAPLSGVLREVLDRAAVQMLERPRVQQLWVGTFTRTHRQLIELLENDTELVNVQGGAVVLDLRPLVIQLGERVAVFGNLAQELGPDAGRVEIMDAGQLETAQNLTQALKFLGNWLWVLPVALAAIALWIARDRKRSILRMLAWGALLAGLLVLVVRRVGGSYIVDDLVESETVKPAAQDAWDILTAQLRDGGFTLIGLGVVLLLAVWLGGTSSSAVSTRRALAPYLARTEVAYGIAAALFLLLLLWAPTVQTTRAPLMIAAAAILVLGVELLRRQTAHEIPDPGPIELRPPWRRGKSDGEGPAGG
jgi:hypothetical protein